MAFGLIAITIVWILLAAVHSLHLGSSGITDNELERRKKAGDHQATFLMRREKVLPEIRALRFLLEVFLQVVFVAVGLAVFGYLLLPLLVLPLLFVGAGANLEAIAHRAQRFYEKFEEDIIRFAERQKKILKLIRQEEAPMQSTLGHSKEELIEKLKTMRGILSKDELALIRNGLKFSTKTVGNIMTPREAIDGIEQEEALGPVTLDQLHNSGHTRFPVYNHDLNHIVGMLHLNEIALLDTNHKFARDAMRTDVAYIHKDEDLEKALATFLHTRQSLLVVIANARKTVGLLGLDDVIEALFGRNIKDEFNWHDMERDSHPAAPGKK